MGCSPGIKKVVNKVEVKSILQSTKCIIKPEMIEKRMINSNDIDLKFSKVSRIGKNPFSNVFKVISRDSGQVRVLKIVKKEQSELNYYKIVTDLEKFLILDHPNIIKLYDYYLNSGQIFLINEFLQGGDLLDMLFNMHPLDESKIATIIRQIISCVCYMHSHRIIHKELRIENILVEDVNCSLEKICIKIPCNYHIESKYNETKRGLPYHLAPEIMKGEFSEKSDIWSCGIILFFLFVGNSPFDSLSDEEFYHMVKNEEYLPLIKHVSQQGKRFLKKLLNYNPKNRISAESALKDEWLVTNCKKIKETLNVNFAEKLFDNMKNFGQKDMIQQAVIAYIMHFLYNSQDMGELKKVFQVLDKSGTGRLNSRQLKEGFEKITGNSYKIEDFEKIMSNVDQDKNGYIEYEEFLRVSVNLKNLLSVENLRQVFYSFDDNKDGKLSMAELTKVLKNSNELIIHELIKEIDQNEDGYLSFPEFCDVMNKLIYNKQTSVDCFDINKFGTKIFVKSVTNMSLPKNNEI